MASLAAQFTDLSIGAYQRYLSPHKGFCCAYRVHTGRRSCSAYARGITQQLGFFALFTALPEQFRRCQLAYQAKAITAEHNRNNNNNNNEKDNTCKDMCDPCPPTSCYDLD